VVGFATHSHPSFFAAKSSRPRAALKFRPEPAHEAAGFFGGPLGVEGDQAKTNLHRPRVGGSLIDR
jgi:hypothetical protein